MFGGHRIALTSSIILTFAAAFSSSYHLSSFPHGYVVLPWQFPAWIIILHLSTAALWAANAYFWPDRAWTQAIIGTTLTAGIYTLRFPILDEIVLGAIVVGLLCNRTIMKRASADQLRVEITSPNQHLLVLLMALLIFNGLRGFIEHSNPKALRLAADAGVCTAFLFLSKGIANSLATRWQLARLLSAGGLIYYIMYLLHGAIFRPLGLGFVLEGIGGAGAGYGNVIGVVALPCSVALLASRRAADISIGAATIVLAAIVAAVGDSRGAMLAILLSAPVLFIAGHWKRTIAFALAGWALALSVGTFALGNPNWIFDIVGSIISATKIESGVSNYEYFGRDVVAAKGDAGRFLYVRTGIEYLSDGSIVDRTIGAGTYGFFPRARKIYEKVALDAGVPTSDVNLGASLNGIEEPPRPPAMGVFLVENGFLGLIFLLGATLAALRDLLKKVRRSDRTLFWCASTTLVIAFVWSYFGEVMDVMFFYFLLLPNGPVMALATAEP